MKIDPDGSVMGEICRRFDNANIIVGYWLSEAYKDAIKAGTSEDYKKWFDFAVDSFINESVKIMDKPYMSPFGFSFKLSEAASPLAATAGIGEALITTAAGLIATLILVFPYNFLLGLLAKATARLEDEEDENEEDDKEEA